MCGIGFIADLHGRKHHKTLRLALGALKNLQHRGGINADGLTSDGVGVLTQIPRELLCDELEQMGLPLERPEDLAVGMLFLPPQESDARLRAIVEHAIGIEDLRLLSWRQVPIRPEFLGAEATASLPRIMQVLVCRPPDLDDSSYERHLHLARRRIERDLQAQEIVGRGMRDGHDAIRAPRQAPLVGDQRAGHNFWEVTFQHVAVKSVHAPNARHPVRGAAP